MPDSNELDDILSELKQKNDNDAPEETSEQNIESDIAKDNPPESNEPVKDADELISHISRAEEYAECDPEDLYTPPGRKKAVIIVIAVIAVVAVALATAFGVLHNKNKEPETTVTTTTTTTTTAAPIIYVNPLTNEPDYNKDAADKRPVALVVENAYQARPQWGIDDENNPPDIIVEGEVEGGESRMLWLYADYTALPEQVGPMRSARPPFIKFSELFDAIFIHWGQSSSKGDYVGADSVFSQDNVDHINQMAFNDTVGLYGRDKTRNVSTEHTGVLYGKNLPAAIDKLGFRTEANEKNYTKFSFNSEAKAVGTDTCSTLALKFSSRSKIRDWAYNAEDKMYHSTDYQTDVSRKNLLILFDQTEYVVKSNYKNSGSSETYCNYRLAGGNGKLASQGTVTDIIWSVENGVIVIKDSQGKPVNLNTGTTWIGYASSNNGGSVTIA